MEIIGNRRKILFLQMFFFLHNLTELFANLLRKSVENYAAVSTNKSQVATYYISTTKNRLPPIPGILIDTTHMRCRYFYFRRIFVQPKFFRILPHKSIGISVFKRKKRVLSKLLSKFIASYLKI